MDGVWWGCDVRVLRCLGDVADALVSVGVSGVSCVRERRSGRWVCGCRWSCDGIWVLVGVPPPTQTTQRAAADKM